MHVFFKEAAALAFANVYVVCNILQRNRLGVVFPDEGQNCLQPRKMLGRPGMFFRKSVVVVEKLLPYETERQMYG